MPTTHPFASQCGIYCGDCEYREKENCPGCVAAEGNMFWGECPLAACCREKGLDNCGLCPEFPCEKLNEFAYAPDQGDDGQRIENLRQWKEIGFDAWVAARGEEN